MTNLSSKNYKNLVSGHQQIQLFSTDSKLELDKRLSGDVKRLGSILGDHIKQNNPEVFEAVEKLRLLRWRNEESEDSFEEMVELVKTFDANTMLGVSRSFAVFLSLSNAAENQHKVRIMKDLLMDSEFGLYPRKNSCCGTIDNLIENHNVSKEAILESLLNQTVEIVLTAHPTEVNRRTMLRKLTRISTCLGDLDDPRVTPYEQSYLHERIKSQVTAVWESDTLRRTKPTPLKEAKSGFAIVETVLWDAVPDFLRKLNHVVEKKLGQSLPLTATPVKIASWMGGDRDGNPNVTPEVTFEVSMMSRWMAASLLRKDLASLRASLSMTSCTDEIAQAAGNDREPYRKILEDLEVRLDRTIELSRLYITDRTLTDHEIRAEHRDGSDLMPRDYATDSVKPILRKEELLKPLLMMHKSLKETNLDALADGWLTDTIRRLSVFGMTLTPLDIRQESTRHTEALDAITRYLGLGSYAQWDEHTRRTWLQHEMVSKRPLLPRGLNFSKHSEFFSPTVIDTLRTFETMAEIGEESIGAYVISQCRQASDIMAVLLLQVDAGIRPVKRVVPLFETLDDLERAPETIEALFSATAYTGFINNKQEIMVGYSDSAKDAGRLAAVWAQYIAQTEMIKVANRHGIEVTFFHGKGGTVGRGGNPALYEAILAHPPGTINGRFRITEQGEMITQNFSQVAVAERTLDYFSAGVLSEKFLPRPAVKEEWAAAMNRMSEVSCKAYRQIVREEERFVPYFRTATPELELSGLNVGSRPAKRNPKGGVESLRAIPWVFSWTQTRLNLPTWLGVGEALSQELKNNPDIVKEMYLEWPWFRTVIDLLEMILAKSDSKIAENYDKQLVTDEASLTLGNELRDKMYDTMEAVLAVSGSKELQENNQILINLLDVRNTYIDPLNVLQAELLRRLRNSDISNEEERAVLQDALLITINGIANGMRNSG